MGIAAKSVDLSILGTKVGKPESLDVSFTSTQSAELLYPVNAVDFSSTNSSSIVYPNHLLRDIDLEYEAGNTYTKAMTLSYWVKPSFGASEQGFIGYSDNGDTVNVGEYNVEFRLILESNSSTQLRSRLVYQVTLVGTDGSGDEILIGSPYGSLTNNAWNHQIITVQINKSGQSYSTNSHVYVNGSSVSHTFDDSDYDGTARSSDNVANVPTRIGKYFNTGDFCLTELFVDDQFYDLSTTSELRKFYSADGKPVNPPSSKLVHLTGNATTWTNLGSSNLGTPSLNFVTDCADSPSD